VVESITLYSFTLSQLIEPGQLLQAVIEGKEAPLTLCMRFSAVWLLLSLDTMECTCLHGREGLSWWLLPWLLKFFRQD